jgi:hypothetical protein
MKHHRAIDEAVEGCARNSRVDPRILLGPFREQLAIYAGQASHERVAIFCSSGRTQRVTCQKEILANVLPQIATQLLNL